MCLHACVFIICAPPHTHPNILKHKYHAYTYVKTEKEKKRNTTGIIMFGIKKEQEFVQLLSDM